MPGPIQRDSLSRCENPSMLYDTIRNPNARNLPPKPIDDLHGIRDTLETTQQRLNREMLERFQNTSSRVSHHSFVIVAQTGKYLFLAIMIPPYLCFYGIPRWLLINLLPQFFLAVKCRTLLVGKYAVEFSNKLIDMMKGILEQMIGDSLKLINQKAKNLFEYLSQSYQALIMPVKKTFIHILKTASSTNHTFHRTVNQIISAMTQKFRYLVDQKEKILDIAQMILEKLLYPLNIADQLLITPLTNLILKNVKKIYTIIKKFQMVSITLSALREKLKKVIQVPINAIKGVAHAMSDYVLWATEHTYQQMSLWLHPLVVGIKTFGGRTRAQLNAFIKTALSVRKKVEEVAFNTSEAAKNGIHFLWQFFVQSTDWDFRLFLKKRWQNIQEKARRGGNFFKSAGSAFRVAGSMLVNHSKSLFFKSLSLGKQLIAWLGMIVLWIVTQLIEIPRKITNVVIKAIKMVFKITELLIWGVRLFLAWIWVVSSCGLALMNELNQEIGSWVKINDK